MLTDTEISRFKCSLEPMETGKSSLFFRLILSSNREEPIHSQTSTQIAQDAKPTLADKNAPRASHIPKPPEITYADTHALKMEVGKKKSTQEYTETSRSSKL